MLNTSKQGVIFYYKTYSLKIFKRIITSRVYKIKYEKYKKLKDIWDWEYQKHWNFLLIYM